MLSSVDTADRSCNDDCVSDVAASSASCSSEELHTVGICCRRHVGRCWHHCLQTRRAWAAALNVAGVAESSSSRVLKVSLCEAEVCRHCRSMLQCSESTPLLVVPLHHTSHEDIPPLVSTPSHIDDVLLAKALNSAAVRDVAARCRKCRHSSTPRVAWNVPTCLEQLETPRQHLSHASLISEQCCQFYSGTAVVASSSQRRPAPDTSSTSCTRLLSVSACLKRLHEYKNSSPHAQPACQPGCCKC